MVFGLHYTGTNTELMFPLTVILVTGLWLFLLFKKYALDKKGISVSRVLHMGKNTVPIQITVNKWTISLALMLISSITIVFLFHTSQVFMIPGDAWRPERPNPRSCPIGRYWSEEGDVLVPTFRAPIPDRRSRVLGRKRRRGRRLGRRVRRQVARIDPRQLVPIAAVETQTAAHGVERQRVARVAQDPDGLAGVGARPAPGIAERHGRLAGARAVGERGTALLDLREIDRRRFPALMAALAREGFDPARELIPVSPAAHYTMGGVVTDLHGRTDVPGLYAAGECACTGVHGANRLASNSLLECLVFGRRAALAALGEPGLSGRDSGSALEPDPIEPVTAELRGALWRNCGLVRDAAGLEQLRSAPHLLARLVAESALAREESRGSHFRADFPAESRDYERHVVLRRGSAPVLETWS